MSRKYKGLLLFGLLLGLFILPLVYGQANDTVDVKTLGAVGDGKANDTVSIQKAIDTCAANGGGTVLLSKGTYLSGPLYLKSKITFKVDTGATLLASNNTADFQVGNKTLNFINTSLVKDASGALVPDSISDVTLTGDGVIDGNGALWWKLFVDSGKKLSRPRLIYLTNVKNLRIENLTLTNSPSFHVVPLKCENVDITGIKIIAPAKSPNTDGIDPSRSKNMRITNCTFDDGDDCIALKSGKEGDTLGNPCENIEVSNCTFLHGHGLSIGSETNSGVRNLKVTNCTFKGTDNGIRIKSAPGLGGLIENVSYSNITMEGVKNPILIDFGYVDNEKGPSGKPTPTTDIPTVHGLTISNLTVTKSANAGKLMGLAESPLQNIVLTKVSIAAQTGMTIQNAQGVQLTDVQVVPQIGPPYILKNAQGKGF